MKRVLIVSHADADGHVIAEQARRNLSTVPSFDVSLVVDPDRTRNHRTWTRLDLIPEIDPCEIVLFVDLMFAPKSFEEEADALVDFVRRRPSKLFFVLDHHNLPIERLRRAANLRSVYQPDVVDCTFGVKSRLMVLAALLENQPTRAGRFKRPDDDLIARGIKRAAALGGPLAGSKLLALLRFGYWDELKKLGQDEQRFHYLPRGRRSEKGEASALLTRLDTLATRLLKSRNPSSAHRGDPTKGDSMSFDFETDSARSAPTPTIRTASGRDLEAIVTLLHLAAVYLTDGEGSTFTAEQLLAKARELAGDQIQLDENDLKMVLGKTGFLKKLHGSRFRLK